MVLPLTAAKLITALLITWSSRENYISNTPSQEIAVLQTCLQALNYAPGPVDGWPGPQTKTAVERWAKACFGAEWQQQTIPDIAVTLEVECHAALYKSEPLNFSCKMQRMR